jgi:hypothetical protein
MKSVDRAVMSKLQGIFSSRTPNSMRSESLVVKVYMIQEGSVALEYFKTSLHVANTLNQISPEIAQISEMTNKRDFFFRATSSLCSEPKPASIAFPKGSVFFVHEKLQHRIVVDDDDVSPSVLCGVFLFKYSTTCCYLSPFHPTALPQFDYPSGKQFICGEDGACEEVSLIRYLFPIHGVASCWPGSLPDSLVVNHEAC